jgi:hypothetical protein
VGGGGVNQLLLCLNNIKSIKPFLIFHQVTINIIHNMNNINNEHQSHIRYTQRHIFTRKPIKGENLFFFKMIGSLLSFCTSSMFEHQLKVRLLPLFYKLQLFESTNSFVSLALTRRKHQLPECSSTDWMEAPTSTYTSTNLFESTNSLVSLAPTRRKHQLPECSNTDWMEAPTSSYTSTNLHIENSVFSQAPPCHPVF